MTEKDFPSVGKWTIPDNNDIKAAIEHSKESDGITSSVESGIAPEILENLEEIRTTARQAFVFLRKAKEAGVSEKVLEEYFQLAVGGDLYKGNLTYAYRLRSHLGLGSDETIKQSGILAYEYCMEKGDFDLAQRAAAEIFGEESREFAAANEANLLKIQRQEKAERKYRKREAEAEALAEVEEFYIVLSLNATVADLENSIEFNFEEEIFHADFIKNFGSETHLAYLDFSETEAAKEITVLDFFKKYGYGKWDIEDSLPIRFE